MCIDSNKRLPLLLATAIVGMVNICNAVPAVGAPMPADSNAVSFVGISRDAEGAHAVDVGDGTYGFAGLTAETGLGIAAGVAVGIHGSDVATAGFYTMVNGVPQDTLTSQGLQSIGVPQDWANGIDAGVSMAGAMGVGAATRGTIVACEQKTLWEGSNRKAVEGTGKLQLRRVPRFSDDASALIKLSKQVRRSGVSREDAQTLLEWAREYNVPAHGPEQHLNRNFKDWHIHIGPVDHIIITP